MKNFMMILKAILLIPIFMIVAYVGFWITMLSGPLIIGLIVFGIIYMMLAEYQASQNESQNEESK